MAPNSAAQATDSGRPAGRRAAILASVIVVCLAGGPSIASAIEDSTSTTTTAAGADDTTTTTTSTTSTEPETSSTDAVPTSTQPDVTSTDPALVTSTTQSQSSSVPTTVPDTSASTEPPTTEPNDLTAPLAVTVASAPTLGTLTPGNRTVVVRWSAPSNTGGTAITKYLVQAWRSPAADYWTFAEVPAGTHSVTSTELVNGARYYFRVIAVNEVGNSAPSTPALAIPRTVPSAPRLGTLTPGNRTVVVRWSAPTSTGGAAITKYLVQAWRSPAADYWTFATLPASARSVTSTQLVNGARYYYRVIAVNEAGNSAPSTPALAIPRTVPSAPRLGTLTPGNHTVVVRWSAPTSTGGAAITKYLVQAWRSPAAGYWTFATVPATARSVTSTGVVNGARYYYRVIAVNAAGNSAPSTPALVIPGARNCASMPSRCGWPDGSNTGAPAGTTLTPYTGPSTITTPNTVIDGKRLGCIRVSASGVIIRNSLISCPGGGVYVDDREMYGKTPLLIEDTEIDCQDRGGTGISEAHVVARRVDIHGCENGLSINQNVVIEDSYIHDLYNGGDAHMDGIQLSFGHWNGSSYPCCARNVTIRRNTIYAIDPSGAFGTSAIISNKSPDQNILIQGNLLAGGAYTLYCVQGATGNNYRVIDNQFSTYFSPNVGAFGAWTDCEDEVLSGNVIHETGLSLSPF
jgi:hypothetical protein